MYHSRKAKGALLYLCLALLFLLIIIFSFSCHIVEFIVEKQRYQQALEAAAIRAAADLSEIVINDPYFGFVSLSDYPAIGLATIAKDGEPLPVHGLNTLIATSRLDYIIAKEIGSDQLAQLALEDLRHARKAAVRLNKVFRQALKVGSKTEVACDMDGKPIHPYADALEAYENSLKNFTATQPDRFELTLGWLRDAGETITHIPESDQSGPNKRKTYVPLGTEINGCYRAYIDVPVEHEHFSFASVGPQPTLVNTKLFVPVSSQKIDENLESQIANLKTEQFIPEKYNEYLSCIVRAQADWKLTNLWPSDKAPPMEFSSEACGQPYAIFNQPSPSILVVAFPDGCPPGINSINDILTNKGLSNTLMNVYTPMQGDFPVEPAAFLAPSIDGITQMRAANILNLAFYDWLRSNCTLPKVDSILGALNQPLLSNNQSRSAGCILVIEVTHEGNVAISSLYQNPFADIRINENQLYAVNCTPATIGGNNWSVVCRDQVHTLGTIIGGKHSGQPMPGDPVNWSDLNSYVNNAFATTVAGRKPQHITLYGDTLAGGGIALRGSQLQCSDGSKLPRNLRKSAYSGGLAIEIRISSPMSSN